MEVKNTIQLNLQFSAQSNRQILKQFKAEKMKTRILSLVLIAVFAISTTVIAQSEKGKKKSAEQKEMMTKRNKGMKERQANFFTEEQKEKMKELRLETTKQVKPLKNELNELNAKQQTLTTAENADLGAINTNIDKIAVVKADIQKVMAAQHQEVRAMLTDEQLLKFDAMKNKRGEKRGKFDGRRGDRADRGTRGEKEHTKRG